MIGEAAPAADNREIGFLTKRRRERIARERREYEIALTKGLDGEHDPTIELRIPTVIERDPPVTVN